MNPTVLQWLVAVGGCPCSSPSLSLTEQEAVSRRWLCGIWLYGEAVKHLSSEEGSPSSLVSGYCLSSSQFDAACYTAVPTQYLIFLGKMKYLIEGVALS